jgi:hypothetical protein
LISTHSPAAALPLRSAHPISVEVIAVWQSLQPIIESLFVGPVWPASVLLLLVLGYLLLSLGIALDLDSPDLDFDAHGMQSLGAATLRWLHLDTIPIAIWGGLFACVNWLLAYILWNAFDSARHDPTWLPSLLLATRNGVIAAVITKFATAPLAPYFGDAEVYSEETLIGQSCIVSSGEATATFGQAKFNTGGAPLLLNIRTDGPHLVKGTSVRIIAFDPSKRIYSVTPSAAADTGPSSETQA